jgi:hypothetical protein
VLKRFWRELMIRIEGDGAALTRMPPDLVDFADGMWQRAVKLAGGAAAQNDKAAHERLARIHRANELAAQSIEIREKENEDAARARERALADSREHRLLLMKSLGREQATVRSEQARIADFEAQIEQYRRQLAKLIAGALAENRVRTPPFPR